MNAKEREPVEFTARALARVVCPSSGKPDKQPGQMWISDPDVPGLRLMVRETGVKTFYWARRVHGRYEQIKLGALKEPGDSDGLTVEQARRRAGELNSQKAEGKNPRADITQANAEPTLAEAWAAFLEWGKAHKKSWRSDETNYRRFLSRWGTRRLSAISHHDVQTWHTGIGSAHGKYIANRVLAMFSTIFSHARVLVNPCKGIKRFVEKQRERFLHADELPRFFKALDAEPNEMLRDFFWLSLLTGARRSNVAAMRWENVNLERATWLIPETKAGGSQTVTLPPRAVEILTVMSQNGGKDTAWVFPSHGATGHLVEPKSAWKRILAAAKIDDLRLHDLRRTLGSWQAATGSSLPIIGKSLGHRQQSTTQIYARLDLDPVRASVNIAAAAMLATAEEPKGEAERSQR